jgi:DnaK suppressor protein
LKKRELQEFRTLLVDRQVKIRENLAYINSEIKELRELEINDDGDYASISNDGNIDSTIGSYQVEELNDIVRAIEKIEKNSESFGFCERCGVFIGRDRLLVKPYALYCKSCRETVDHSEK